MDHPQWYRGQWVKFTYPQQEGICLYKIRSLAKKKIKVWHVSYIFDWDGVLVQKPFYFGGMTHAGGRVESFRIDPLTPLEEAEYVAGKEASDLIIIKQKLPTD
jgi:hypothetical protein